MVQQQSADRHAIMIGTRNFALRCLLSLTEMFSRMAKRMEFEVDDVRDAFSHGGLKGSALETAVVETVLRPYLPEKIGICTGQIIDARGRHSKQLDVVLYDRANTPTLKRSAEIRLLPAECVFAVIEVKTKICSKGDVRAIFDHMASVRALSREAISPDPRLHFVEFKVDGKPSSSVPIHYSCFAFECGISAKAVNNCLDEEAKKRALSIGNCVDMVLTLRPSALWLGERGAPIAFERGKAGREMVEYYLRLHQHLSMAMMSGFLDLKKYLSAK